MSLFRPEIEGLRALSIALVIVYHYASGWLPGGFVGVDIFFVISGYLITLSLAHAHRAGTGLAGELVAFWSRRMRRLLPNALLVLAVVGGVGLFALPDASVERLGADIAWSAAYAVNWLFVSRATDYLRWGETEASVLLNYWSLAVEEQFYLVWPVVLLVAWRWAAAFRQPGPAAAWPARLALVLAASSFVLSLVHGPSQGTLAFFSSPARAWELLAGAWLALVTQGRALPPWCLRHGAAMSTLGLVAVVGAAFAMSHDSRHPGAVTLVPAGGALLLLVGMLAQPGSALARGMASTAMRAVGARSYSLYLWHWPVLMLGKALGAADGALVVLWFALSVLMAEAAYRWVESPARWRWAQGWRPARVLTFGLGASAALLLSGGALRQVAEQGLREGLVAAAPKRLAGLPPLRQTRTDLPAVYALGCHLGLEPVEPPANCRLGISPVGPAALLFGDSHAAQWVPALLPVAAARGVALLAWTKSSCPSADVTVWTEATRSAYAECDRWRDNVFDRIKNEPPALIVVSNLDGERLVLVDRGSGALLRGAAAAAEYEAGLLRTLRRLRAAGVTVVLIRDTPRARPDVLDCLYSTTRPESCEHTRAEALAGSGADLRAAAAAGTPVWDFSDEICGPLRCPVFMPLEGRSVYRDETHMSATFAATLAPAVAGRWPAGLGTAR